LCYHDASQRQCRCDGRSIATLRKNSRDSWRRRGRGSCASFPTPSVQSASLRKIAAAVLPAARQYAYRSEPPLRYCHPGRPARLVTFSDLVTNRTRVRSTRHRRQSEASRRCDAVPILLAIDSLAVFNVIPRYAVLSNFLSASPRCHVSILRLQVCSRRLAVNLRSHNYYRRERQNSDECPSSQTVTSVHDKAPFQPWAVK
jgi:hypothetical protein